MKAHSEMIQVIGSKERRPGSNKECQCLDHSLGRSFEPGFKLAVAAQELPKLANQSLAVPSASGVCEKRKSTIGKISQDRSRLEKQLMVS
jgi:hypothetical protein